MNNETLCAIARQLLKQQQASNSSIVEGLLPTCSPDIDLFYQTSAQELRPTLYAPGLVFLFSGEKSVQLGQNYYVYNPSKALLLTGVYPVYCNIRASEQEPVIGIQIRFERKQVAQLLHHLTVHSDSTSEQMAAAHSHSGFFVCSSDSSHPNGFIRVVECTRQSSHVRSVYAHTHSNAGICGIRTSRCLCIYPRVAGARW
ncbi:AraC family transcriptional regulator [Pseudomonas aeruginosa]|nr:AraC family transcriptional regulator [Pseudomonas aeruginosa]